MPFKLDLQGYDTLQIGKYQILPDIFELMQQPIFYNASIEDAYRNGSDIQRHLIEHMPITGKYKHIKISCLIQYLTPQWSSIENIAWHLDPGVRAPFNHDAKLHIFCSGYNLTSTTKFLESPVTIELPDELWDARHRHLREYLTARQDEYGFVPKSIPSNHIVTFNNMHLHIAPPPEKPEMRFFLRCQESNVEPPITWDKAYTAESKALIGNNNMMTCFQQLPNGVFIRTKL